MGCNAVFLRDCLLSDTGALTSAPPLRDAPASLYGPIWHAPVPLPQVCNVARCHCFGLLQDVTHWLLQAPCAHAA